MTYLVEFKLIRFSLKRLRTETLTIRFREENSGYSILAKAYGLTKDGWDRGASSEIDVSDDKNHVDGKWWLDAVLRIPDS
ncbi:hypothetical protein ACSOCI_09100 [Levilactobacillus brevis]|uniref:hypothetical protein n=1 Tax=Levilactobacillus brevis TaxID=1580 RepID=UPI003F603F61